MAGNQFNSDFEIGVSDPDTAEPTIQAEFESSAGLADQDMDITHVHFTAMQYYPTVDGNPLYWLVWVPEFIRLPTTAYSFDFRPPFLDMRGVSGVVATPAMAYNSAFANFP